MSYDSVNTKQVKVEFHYMSVERKKRSSDSTIYDIGEVISTISAMFSSLIQKKRIDRKHDFTSREKTIWLEKFTDLGNGNFDVIFMSARYNRSRNVIDTETMKQKGMLKQPKDGDEEKTHFCIRFKQGQDRFITINERNSDGITINEIMWYLNQQFEAYHIQFNTDFSYSVSFDIVLSKDFLTELKKMNNINLLTLAVDKSDPLCSDFLRLAGRDSIKDTVNISLGKKRGKGNNIPIDLIEEYFNETGSYKRIKKISVQGSNSEGSLKIDTDSIQLKHILEVKVIGTTNEVDSTNFFTQAKSVVPQIGD